MGDHSGSTRFRVQFESALQAYEKQVGITLAEHPLAVQLQNCHSVEPITTLLKYKALADSDLQGSDTIMKSIESSVSILCTLSATASFGEAIGLVCQHVPIRLFHIANEFLQPLPPAKAIIAGLAILLAVCTVLQFLWAYLL